MFQWKIFYGDGSTFTDSEGSAYDAPSRNVQLVVAADLEHGWSILRQFDFYWWDADCWRGGDQFGLWDYLCLPGPKKVIFGRTINHQSYMDVFERALNDPDLPQKTAWRDEEPQPPGA